MTNKYRNNLFLMIVTVGMIALQGCNDDDRVVEKPPILLDFELITTVEAYFKNIELSSTDTFTFDDPDGFGGNPPIKLDTVKLWSNTEYELTFKFWDKSNPLKIIDVTPDVVTSAEQHLMCYETNVNGINITILDKDKNNLPLGLRTKVITKETGNGNFKIILRHQTVGKNGSCDIGATDVEVDFPLMVQ